MGKNRCKPREDTMKGCLDLTQLIIFLLDGNVERHRRPAVSEERDQ